MMYPMKVSKGPQYIYLGAARSHGYVSVGYIITDRKGSVLDRFAVPRPEDAFPEAVLWAVHLAVGEAGIRLATRVAVRHRSRAIHHVLTHAGDYMRAFAASLSEFDERGRDTWHEVYPHEANYDKYQDASLGAHEANEEEKRLEAIRSVDFLEELLGDPF